MPGDNAITGELAEEVDAGEFESLAMTSAMSLAGGAVKALQTRPYAAGLAPEVT